MRKYRQAQAILEYALFIGVIVGVFVLMWNYMNRSLQGKLKSSADSVGSDFSARTGTSRVSKNSSSFTFEDGLTPIGLVISSGSSSRNESTRVGLLADEDR
jgi:hypothetical protein